MKSDNLGEKPGERLTQEQPIATFCPFCGNKVLVEINGNEPEKDIICWQCGEILNDVLNITNEDYFIMQCEKCFEHNIKEAKYCARCGNNKLKRTIVGVKKKKQKQKRKLFDNLLNPKGKLFYIFCIIPNVSFIIFIIAQLGETWFGSKILLIVLGSIVGVLDLFFFVAIIINLTMDLVTN